MSDNKTDNWIRVSERLPDESGLYNIKNADDNLGVVFFVRNVRGDHVWLVPNPNEIKYWRDPLKHNS